MILTSVLNLSIYDNGILCLCLSIPCFARWKFSETLIKFINCNVLVKISTEFHVCGSEGSYLVIHTSQALWKGRLMHMQKVSTCVSLRELVNTFVLHTRALNHFSGLCEC